MSTDRIPPQRLATVGSWVVVAAPSLVRSFYGRVYEVDGEVVAVETEVGVIRVRRADC